MNSVTAQRQFALSGQGATSNSGIDARPWLNPPSVHPQLGVPSNSLTLRSSNRRESVGKGLFGPPPPNMANVRFALTFPPFKLSLSSEKSNPLRYQHGQTINNFPTEQNFIDVPHVEHVNDTAQIRTTALPPGVSVVQNQVVLYINAFRRAQFFKFQAVQ
jgi:hypothetical protein